MTGFIKKLFRSKPADEVVEPTRPAAPTREGNAFYLDFDSAQTFGNLEYMRSSKSVRRTFSKKKLGEDNESIRTISAMEARKGSMASSMSNSSMANGLSNNTMGQTNGQAQPGSAGDARVMERRKADSSLDMFRSMAREIKKGN